MATKELNFDGVVTPIGAEAQNVEYTNTAMTGVSNVKQALDAIAAPACTDVVHTEDDCTVKGSGIYVNGGESSNGNYNCSDYIPIPYGVKMYIKMDFAYPDNYGLCFYQNRTGSYEWMQRTSIVSIGALADYTEFAIPDNAAALRFTQRVDGHISIKFAKQDATDKVVKLKVAAWNIGAFAGGGSESTITDANVEEKRSAYRKVFDEVNADIICLSEYYHVFNTSTSSTPQGEVLCNYPYYKIGASRAYNCNAVFSKLPILQTREVDYTTKTQGRYLKDTTLELNGKVVKVVATHLDFDSNYVPQLQQIISMYANDPYVIIGADFNIHVDDTWGDYVSGDKTDGYLNYKYLTEAGYTLMNFDYLTLQNPWKYPEGDSKAGQLKGSTADNIAVKGFAMGKREYVYEDGVSNELSDHCMVACELVML